MRTKSKFERNTKYERTKKDPYTQLLSDSSGSSAGVSVL